MKFLIIIKSPPVSQVVHEIAVSTISELLKKDSVEISGIFFTDCSAAIASKGITQISSLETVQSSYLNLSKEKSSRCMYVVELIWNSVLIKLPFRTVSIYPEIWNYP